MNFRVSFVRRFRLATPPGLSPGTVNRDSVHLSHIGPSEVVAQLQGAECI